MKRHVFHTLLLTVVLTLAFGSCLKVPFFWDDFHHLDLIGHPDKGLKYAGYNSYSSRMIPEGETHDAYPWWLDSDKIKFDYFRPVPTLSLALDLALWGKDPAGFQRTNVTLHVLCILLLYSLSVTLGLRPGFALMGCLAAGLHPNLLFSISWTCNRDNTLSAIFLISTLGAYHFYLRNSVLAEKSLAKTLAPAAALLFFVLGVLSKENIVLAPALLLVLTMIHATFWSRTEEGPSGTIRYLPLAPFFLFSFLYVGWYTLNDHGNTANYILLSHENSLAGNLAIMGKNLYLYLVSFVFFIPPDFDDFQAWVLTWPFGLFSAFFFGSLIGLMLWQRRLPGTLPALWLLLAWFFLFLFTPLWFDPLGRLLYVPVLAYGIFTALFLQGLYDQLSKRLWKACLISPLVFWLVLLPFMVTSMSAAFLAEKGNDPHLDMDDKYAAVAKDLPPESTIFLLNAPVHDVVYMADTVHRFHHPEKGTRICPLGNAAIPPQIHSVSPHGFCLNRPDGILIVNKDILPTRLDEGVEITRSKFRARITTVTKGIVEEVCFSFPDPVDSPGHAFLAFDEGVPRIVSFLGKVPQEITE